MKYLKYSLVLAIALFAFANVSHAQTVQLVGGGSSALFLELGQAAQSSSATGTPCLWTQKKSATTMFFTDSRSGSHKENGNVWVTWSTGSTGTCAAPSGSGINVYEYMSLDSVIGDRCFFEVESSGTSGCTLTFSVTGGTAGANLLTLGTFTATDTAIPASIVSALNGQKMNTAGTDIRPEDAKFASLRMFTACDAALYRFPYNQTLYQTTGLGYQTGTTGVGTPISSFYSTSSFNVLDFNIAGNDPITNQPVRAYTVSTVGAQPIVVVVNGTDANGIIAANDINGFTLTLFLQGVLGRATDLLGPTHANPVITLVRESLSGTYNTMEYSIPNSSQFKASQDYANCGGSGTVNSNPMHLQSTNGNVLAYRNRVIGTGEMTAQLAAASAGDTLGYFFWSSANAASTVPTSNNAKYLTVNGVDPIQSTYTNGKLPGTTGGPALSNVTFQGLNAGDYPIWSALRLVSTSPTPAGVTALIAGAQTLDSTQVDFIPLSKLNVWHSHFYLPAINQGIEGNGATLNTPGDLCGTTGALAEVGGDAGGTNVMKQANADFCADFGNQNGLVNKNN
jgi:hypothetical protein